MGQFSTLIDTLFWLDCTSQDLNLPDLILSNKDLIIFLGLIFFSFEESSSGVISINLLIFLLGLTIFGFGGLIIALGDI
jgi:hypothetical protein